MIKRLLYILLIVIILIIGSVYFYNYDEKDGRLKDTCQALTGALTVLAISYAFLTYEFNYRKSVTETKKNKELLTYNTASEWSKPHMLDYQIILDDFYQSHDSNDPDYYKKFFDDLMDQKNIEVRKAFACIFNYLETISLAVRQDLVDVEFTKIFLYDIFEFYYNTYKGHIKYREEKRNVSDLWYTFTHLAQEWQEKKLQN